MEDSSIIELFFARSEEALSTVRQKYGRLCDKIAADILRNHEDAEECVSSSYMKLWDAIPPKKPQSLCGYLCAIVRNTAINLVRSEKSCVTEQYDELCEIIPDSETTESRFDSAEIGRYINSFLDETAKKSRQIFVQRYYFNLSVKSIAEAMDMSEGAVKTQLFRTREALRKYLTERGVEI